MENRRKNPRVGVSFPVECSVASEKNYFYTVSKDLSNNGVKILAGQALSKGASLRLNINLINKIVDVLAKVAWCNKERASERYCVGLEFLEMDKLSQETLGGFLSKVS